MCCFSKSNWWHFFFTQNLTKRRMFCVFFKRAFKRANRATDEFPSPSAFRKLSGTACLGREAIDQMSQGWGFEGGGCWCPGRVSTTTWHQELNPRPSNPTWKWSSKKKPVGVGRGATPNCQSRGNFSDFVSIPMGRAFWYVVAFAAFSFRTVSFWEGRFFKTRWNVEMHGKRETRPDRQQKNCTGFDLQKCKIFEDGYEIHSGNWTIRFGQRMSQWNIETHGEMVSIFWMWFHLGFETLVVSFRYPIHPHPWISSTHSVYIIHIDSFIHNMGLSFKDRAPPPKQTPQY